MMTPRERAEKLAGARPCNYGGPFDDAAERKWIERVDSIESEIVAACADALAVTRRVIAAADELLKWRGTEGFKIIDPRLQEYVDACKELVGTQVLTVVGRMSDEQGHKEPCECGHGKSYHWEHITPDMHDISSGTGCTAATGPELACRCAKYITCAHDGRILESLPPQCEKCGKSLTQDEYDRATQPAGER